MLDIFGYDVSVTFLVYLMLSFAFFVGVLLMVSQEAFIHFSNALQKEFGVKRRLFPKIEDTYFDIIDRVLIKYRILAGLVIAIVSFALLLFYKMN